MKYAQQSSLEKNSRKHPDSNQNDTPPGYRPAQGDPNDGGKLKPEEAERIQSSDLPVGDPGLTSPERSSGGQTDKSA